MKKICFSLMALAGLAAPAFAADVTVLFSGLQPGDAANLTIASSEYLRTIPVTTDGTFVFDDVPAGIHSVKAEARGYNVIEALTVVVDESGTVAPSEPLKIPVTKMDPDTSIWNFEWKEDGSPAGYTTTSNVNSPAEIEFLGKQIVPSDVPSSAILQNEWHIVLADDEKPWTQEYAYRMVETLKTLPVDFLYEQRPSRFSLTEDHLENDITVVDLGDGYEVRVSEDIFYYANPFLVNLDGVRGKLYSKRLHHALTNFLTDFGRDTRRVDDILRNRFGCSIMNVDYEELTRGITNEDAACFQNFHPSELVSIINMFEELPEGFHKIPHLKYLIRRQDGHPHPLYPGSAAVSWCVENGYIEFMEVSFGANSQSFDTLRLLLHEKTHFLWEYLFSDSLKEEWAEIGGWYRNPNAVDGWSTTKDVEFVSAYAHAHTPNEDMAESVAYYLQDPDKLRSRSMEKYEFIRDRIMHGVRYLATVPDHLSFEVLNLCPDYDYPGKIKRVNVWVSGESDEEKQITVEVELNHIEGYDDGASSAGFRLTSPAFLGSDGTLLSQFVDIGLFPIDESGHILQGTCVVPKYGKAGHWTAGDVTVTDLNGNARYEGYNDCVLDVYVNNSLEDTEPPVYVPGSLKYELTDSEIEGRHCQNLKITFEATDNVGISTAYVDLYAEYEGENNGGVRIAEAYGDYDAETHLAEINVTIFDYFRTSDYYVAALIVRDMAGTTTWVNFSESPLHQPVQKIFIETPTPDTAHPEIDLNRIYVYAEPTHPEAPDGETKVTINFYCRDDISGFGPCHYHFIDPQGVLHGNYWFYHENFYTSFFDGDPTLWTRYQIVHILPQGSAPGRWGLGRMMVCDKAGNEFIYNFVETLIFEPDDDMSKYILFADMEGRDTLYLRLVSDSGSRFGYNYRVVHEESGMEITGSFSASGESPAFAAALYAEGSELSEGSEGMEGTEGSEGENRLPVDVSSLPDGELVVIANILDAEGKIESSKMARVTKKGVMTSVDAAPADALRVMVAGRRVSVFSDRDRTLRVATPDGRVSLQRVAAGKTIFTLPAPGLYLIENRKYLAR